MTLEDYIRENFRYDSKTGDVYYTCQNKKCGPKRNLVKPVGSNHRGYLRVNTPFGHLYLHRLCWFLYYGVWPEKEIDHTNRVRSDNRVENLRLASDQQNCFNRDQNYGTSKYKGVSKRTGYNKWNARITLNGKTSFLGSFDTEEEAYKKYLSESEKLFGEYSI